MPAYHDDEAACEVIRRVAGGLPAGTVLDVTVVDDRSRSPIRLSAVRSSRRPGALGRCRVIHLSCNLGHQRAIAVGLVDALGGPAYDHIIVMDSDGEDLPEAVPRLLSAADAVPSEVVVAVRGVRSEGWVFRAGYRVYRVLFHALTGASLPFGNFSVISPRMLPRITAMPELWNHYAATLRKSGLPITAVVVDRGTRIAGRSRMDFTSLVSHGLSAIAAFSERVFARLLAAFLAVTALLSLAAVCLVLLRLLTDMAIPGWTTTIGGLIGIALLQVGSVIALLTFMMLRGRSSPMINPASYALDYIQSVSEVST